MSVFGQAIQEAIDEGRQVAPDRSTSRRFKTTLSLQEHFQIFHQANPRVYAILVSLAWQAKDAGHKHLGIGLLWERMRWEMMLDTQSEEHKLNNNYRSRYVRLIEDNESGLQGFFRRVADLIEAQPCHPHRITPAAINNKSRVPHASPHSRCVRILMPT